MPRLSYTQRVQVATLHDEGWTNVALARRFNVQRRTIIALIAKHRAGEQLLDRHHTGRPRKTTERDDKVLGRLSMESLTAVSRSLRQRWLPHLDQPVSASTVRRRLRSAGLVCRVAKRKPLLSARHRQMRLEWANTHRNWTPEQWRRVIFSDDVPLQIIQQRSRRYV